MKNSKVIADFGKLDALTQDMQENRRARVKVGILAEKSERFDIMKEEQDKDNNAQIGLLHEFGGTSIIDGHAVRVPARSWLRMPLIMELPKKLKLIGDRVWVAVIQDKGLIFALENLGAAAVQTIEMAFRSGGFGRWAPLHWLTIRRKKSTAILIDTGKFRRAVSFAVVNGGKRVKS